MAMARIDSPETLPDWFMPWPGFTVDWNRSALLVIDYQNYSVNPEVGLMRMISERFPSVAVYYVPRVQNVTIPNTRRLLEQFRASGREVVYTRHGALLRDGRDMIARRRRRDEEALVMTDRPALWAKGSYEHEILDAVAPRPGELVIDKNASSAFNGSAIDQLLRNMGIETLVVAGMATDMCVETTSRDAADRGYNVIIVEDAVATFFEAHHVAALSGFARVFGQVWDTARVVAALAESAGEPAGIGR